LVVPGRREIRPDIGATLAAGRADELILDVGNPDVISPLARVHFDRVAALVVGATDQDAIGAGLPHFSEGYFLLAGESGHHPLFRWDGRTVKAGHLDLGQTATKISTPMMSRIVIIV
jgi:hypothetical protein